MKALNVMFVFLFTILFFILTFSAIYFITPHFYLPPPDNSEYFDEALGTAIFGSVTNFLCGLWMIRPRK